MLYVRNLTTSVSEEKIRETFECHGRVERVKKIKDYAFVHFEDRKQAIAAMQVGGRKEEDKVYNVHTNQEDNFAWYVGYWIQ